MRQAPGPDDPDQDPDHDEPDREGVESLPELQAALGKVINHPPLSQGAGVGGLVVGLPLALVGGAVTAAVEGLLLLPAGAGPLPAWVRLISLPFALLGLLMVVSTSGALLRAGLRRRAAAGSPEEPWLHDRSWHPRRGQDRLGFKPTSLVSLALFGLFLFPFHLLYLQLASGAGLVVAGAVLALFDLLWLGSAVYAAYALLRSLKYRGAELLWPGVPLLVGQTARLTFRLPAALRALPDPPPLVATLRCLSERWQTVRRGDGSSQQLVVTPLHELEQRRSAGEVDEEGQLRLEFEVPPGAPSTQLLGSDLVYWELEVQAETPGIDYRGLFLVPVY